MDADPLTVAVSAALIAMKRVGLAKSPDDIDHPLIALWVQSMCRNGITLDEIERAAATVIDRETFFPSPSAFINIARPPINDDLRAEAAWQAVLHCVRAYGQHASLTYRDTAGDRAALWALEKMGWGELCEMLEIENRNLKRAEFVRLYRLAREMGARLEYLVGALERDNALKGVALAPALCGRPDWTALPERPQPLPADRGMKELGETVKALAPAPICPETSIPGQRRPLARDR